MTTEKVIATAALAAKELAKSSPKLRAKALTAVADALEMATSELVEAAMQETGLSSNRLSGEIRRTAVQLRMFAEVVTDGAYLGVRIDPADDEFILGPRPDIRLTHVPVGPVINFAASNFPFAFSVLGGDTAAIIAAGCPVIVKANPGHPKTSDLTAEIAIAALTASGMPEGTLQVIHNQDDGLTVLKDPRIKAGAFTGSIKVGRLLADIAAARPAPIPFFGELGSVNPVFITAAALAERAPEIAAGYLVSVSGSAGQLCTKPGFVFVEKSADFVAAVRDATVQNDAVALPEQRLLGPRIAQNFAARTEAIRNTPGVETVLDGKLRIDEEQNGWAAATIIRIGLNDFRKGYETLVEEAFGPLSIIVETDENTDLAALLREFYEGNLSGTLHLSEEESTGTSANFESLQKLVWAMQEQVGRILFNGWSTGVAVTHAQHHGGPWPATTNDSATSVGSSAVGRFLRPVAYQNAPSAFLPQELRDENPLNVPQSITKKGNSASWAMSADKV